jgi:translocation and assembly module TamA
VALRRIAFIAILILAAHMGRARADSSEGISYRTQILVPGDPDLASEMHDISRLVAKEDAKADSELTLRRRATADLEQLTAAARAAGYYDAELSYEIDSKSRPWRVSVKVKLGVPYRLREIRIVTPQGGVPPLAERFDPATLGLELGMRAKSAPIVEAEGKLLRYYTSRGRPLAKVAGHEAIIDRADHSMHVTYTIAVGPSAAFGKTDITGLKAVDPRFIVNRLAWKEGAQYDSSQVDSTEQTLVASNLFATVKITPAEKVGADGRIPIRIVVTERPPRTIGGGLYYDSSLGPGAKAFWEHRNLFGEGESLHLEVTFAQSDYGLLAQFKRPYFLTQGLDLRAEASVADLMTDAYDSKRATAFTGLDYDFGDKIAGGVGVEFLKGHVEDDTGTQDYTLAALPTFIRRDDTDDILNPTRGTRLGLTATPYTSVSGESLTFLNAKLTASGYQRLGSSDRFVLAGFGSIGSIAGTSLDALPRDLRLYEGGGGSVRAYGYQRAGPLDQFDNPLGGLSSLVLGIELRAKITDTIGAVAFVEGGNVYDSSLPDLSQALLWGPGVGLRYFSPIGPLRFDIATPFDRRSGDGVVQFYISLGQAF